MGARMGAMLACSFSQVSQTSDWHGICQVLSFLVTDATVAMWVIGYSQPARLMPELTLKLEISHSECVSATFLFAVSWCWIYRSAGAECEVIASLSLRLIPRSAHGISWLVISTFPGNPVSIQWGKSKTCSLKPQQRAQPNSVWRTHEDTEGRRECQVSRGVMGANVTGTQKSEFWGPLSVLAVHMDNLRCSFVS